MLMIDRKVRLRLILSILLTAILIALPVFGVCTSFADSVPSNQPGYGAEIIYTNEDSGYSIIINDEEDLLSDEEEAKLLQDMIPLTEFGYVGFFSIRANRSTESYCNDLYRSYFGGNNGTIFVIDMGNRIIQVTSGGSVYRVVNKSYANTITDNVYRYASRGEYYECAKNIYSQELTLLKGGRVAQPMKHITNLLVAITLAILINYVIVAIQRRHINSVAPRYNMGTAATMAANISSIEKVGERRYREVEVVVSSGGGGGSGGGGFSGGGGGFSGGGGGFSGGSVGGGGHSF